MMAFLHRQWQGLWYGGDSGIAQSAGKKWPLVAPLVLGAFLVGCGGGDTPALAGSEEDTVMSTPSGDSLPVAVVRIVAPLDGSSVEGGAVEIVLESEGVEIAPVDQGRMGTAHHHLFINTDVTPMGEVIPMGREGIVHMGDGSTAFILRDLAPGEYRIIAVLADLLHIPLDPPAVDTIFITVR